MIRHAQAQTSISYLSYFRGAALKPTRISYDGHMHLSITRTSAFDRFLRTPADINLSLQSYSVFYFPKKYNSLMKSASL